MALEPSFSWTSRLMRRKSGETSCFSEPRRGSTPGSRAWGASTPGYFPTPLPGLSPREPAVHVPHPLPALCQSIGPEVLGIDRLQEILGKASKIERRGEGLHFLHDDIYYALKQLIVTSASRGETRVTDSRYASKWKLPF